MISKYTRLAVTLLPLALTACGGGGGSSEPATGAANPEPSVYTPGAGSVTEPAGSGVSDPTPPAAQAASTAELSTTESFKFATQWELAVDFDVAAAKEKDGFLSICTDFSFDGEDAYDVNFDQCAVRASISNGLYNTSINVTNDVDAMLGVIWFSDPLSPPLYQEFAVTNGQESISWR